MKKKLTLVLGALISLSALTPSTARAELSTPQKWGVGALVTAIAYGIYNLFRESTNAELCSAADKAYRSVYAQCVSMELLQNTEMLDLNREGDLFALTAHRDIQKLPKIAGYLNQINNHMSLLKARMDRDYANGKPDVVMNDLYGRMSYLQEKLATLNAFWNNHAIFFTTHSQLQNLTRSYSNYFAKDADTVRRIILGNATALSGNAHAYPFKTVAEQLAVSTKSLAKNMQTLRNAWLASQNAIARSDYAHLMSQAEPFYASLVALRDLVANLPEYRKDIKNYNEMMQRKAEQAAKERAARERAAIERERVQAEREKARATRYAADQERRGRETQAAATVEAADAHIPWAAPQPAHYQGGASY
jgi:hypothetical protein